MHDFDVLSVFWWVSLPSQKENSSSSIGLLPDNKGKNFARIGAGAYRIKSCRLLTHPLPLCLAVNPRSTHHLFALQRITGEACGLKVVVIVFPWVVRPSQWIDMVYALSDTLTAWAYMQRAELMLGHRQIAPGKPCPPGIIPTLCRASPIVCALVQWRMVRTVGVSGKVAASWVRAEVRGAISHGLSIHPQAVCLSLLAPGTLVALRQSAFLRF